MAQNPRFAQTRVRPKHQTTKHSLDSFDMEIGTGGLWVSLNDHLNFRIAAETINTTAQTYRRVEAQNPVVEGRYLIHAVPDHINETVKVYVYGQTMVDVMEKTHKLQDLFGQFDYQIRLTMDSHREYWRCQTADWSLERTHTFAHNGMTALTFNVPRFPTVSYEVLV